MDLLLLLWSIHNSWIFWLCIVLLKLTRYGSLILNTCIVKPPVPPMQPLTIMYLNSPLGIIWYFSWQNAATSNVTPVSLHKSNLHGHVFICKTDAIYLNQVLGYEVDAINSVQFSNHTQYEHVTGQILKSEELKDLFTGLENNKLLEKYTHLLTGMFKPRSDEVYLYSVFLLLQC